MQCNLPFSGGFNRCSLGSILRHHVTSGKLAWCDIQSPKKNNVAFKLWLLQVLLLMDNNEIGSTTIIDQTSVNIFRCLD